MCSCPAHLRRARLPQCRMARYMRMWERRTSINRSYPLRRRARLSRPGRAGSGRTIISPPRCCRIACNCQDACSSSPGGRYDALRDHNYSAGQNTDKPVWLPQYAVTFAPARDITLYTNYGVQLSLGPQGPWWVDNSSEYLNPYNTRQLEAGAKYEPDQRILLAADVFHMRAPFFYPKVLAGPDSFCPSGNAGDLCFESQGRETHNGFELNAQGKAARLAAASRRPPLSSAPSRRTPARRRSTISR